MSFREAIPAGFTMQEVLDCGRQLPTPNRQVFMNTPFRMVLVRVEPSWYEQYPGQSCIHDTVTDMRRLEFECKCELDYSTDEVVYWWGLSGVQY